MNVENLRQNANQIFQAGIAAANPYQAVKKHFVLNDNYSNTEAMNRNIKKIVNQISAILVAGIDARHVYLFGSYADNSANSDSDIDIFIVADLNGKKKLKLLNKQEGCF